MLNRLQLESIYEQIPKVVCPEGCGRCCGPVFPSLAELHNVKIWCAEHHVEHRDFLDITQEGACPYLISEQKCSIYSVRPFLCRLLGVSLDLSCPLGKCTAARILNHSQSDALYGAVYLRGKEKARTMKHRRIVRQALEIIEKGGIKCT